MEGSSGLHYDRGGAMETPGDAKLPILVIDEAALERPIELHAHERERWESVGFESDRKRRSVRQYQES